MTTPSPSFTIRPAALSDAASLAALRGALFRELGHGPPEGDGGAFEDFAGRAFRDELGRESCFAWLAETAGGEPVGSVALLVFPRLPSPQLSSRLEGYLLSVFTEPGWRGRGVATALVAAAVARARDLGLARIRLHATPQGRSVYAAAGFAPRADEMELRW